MKQKVFLLTLERRRYLVAGVNADTAVQSAKKYFERLHKNSSFPTSHLKRIKNPLNYRLVGYGCRTPQIMTSWYEGVGGDIMIAYVAGMNVKSSCNISLLPLEVE